jgi:hypothetical protein
MPLDSISCEYSSYESFSFCMLLLCLLACLLIFHDTVRCNLLINYYLNSFVSRHRFDICYRVFIAMQLILAEFALKFDN